MTIFDRDMLPLVQVFHSMVPIVSLKAKTVCYAVGALKAEPVPSTDIDRSGCPGGRPGDWATYSRRT